MTAGGEAMEIGLRPRVLWIRVAWLALATAGLFAGGAVLIVRLLAEITPNALFVAGVWLFCGVICAVSAIDTWRVAQIRGAAVRLDAHGVLDRRFMQAPAPWADVTKVELQTLEGRPAILGVWAPGAARYRSPSPLWGYFGLIYALERMARPFRFAPISIDLQPLAAPPDQVLAAVERWWGAPRRREIAPSRRDGDTA